MLRSLAIRAIVLSYRAGRTDRRVSGRWTVALLSAVPHLASQLTRRLPA